MLKPGGVAVIEVPAGPNCSTIMIANLSISTLYAAGPVQGD